MKLPWCIVTVILLPVGAARPSQPSQIVEDFETLSRWTHHRDGGNEVKLSLDTQHVKTGQASLRLNYVDKEPHWGNVVAPMTIPRDTTALTFWIYKHRAAPHAAMHVWLMEADGDGWVARVTLDGKIVGEWAAGWHHVVIPLGAFRFDPRGNRQRNFLTVNRMLIGCNFGDLEVSMDTLTLDMIKTSATQPAPRTADLRVRRTAKGSVAIVKEHLPRNEGAASPEWLARTLREAGYAVTFVQFGDLLEPSVLNTLNFDVLVLPNGIYYPAEGKDVLVSFLKDGGSFFSAGGYAFDTPVVFTAKGWQTANGALTAAEMDKLSEAAKSAVRINTRFGRVGDTMGTEPEQIGAFAPSYLLTDVAYAEVATGQHILPPSPSPSRKGRGVGASLSGEGWEGLEGFAATAMTGSNSPVFPNVHARWIPLINAYDGYGRLRGAVGALVHNFAGAFAKSSWAFFGVTNKDVLREPPLSNGGFVRIIDALVEKTFLHSLTTEWACYRQGEPVKMSVKVANHGARTKNVVVELAVNGRTVHVQPVTLNAGETQTVSATLRSRQFHRDLYTVTAKLRNGDHVVDEVQTGFVVWDEKVIQSGPRIALKDNYFCLDDRPTFLSGTNQTGMMWYSASENPLVWDRDFAKMRDCGLTLLRVLHFSPFSAGGYEGRPTNNPLDLKNRPEKLIRQTDAIVQLAQKHGVVLFLTLHDWMNVELTDAELQAQRDWNRFWVERYKNVPGIIFDIQNEPSVRLVNHPDVKREFNEYLRQKYGTTERLRAAWKLQPPTKELGDIDAEGGGTAWEDVKAFDFNFFKVRLLNRWVKANADGIRQGNPKVPFTVGYLPSIPPADKVLGVEHTTFSNMHWYGPLSELPRQLKFIDRRFDGKSFSLGEFGAQEAHDARVRGETGSRDAESIARFLATGHYALGLGASFVANWDWKDFNDCVFPWGLNYAQDLVSKKTLLAFRNMSLFFRLFQPRYEDPGLYLLIPDNHRLGANFNEAHAAILNSLRLLIQCHVNFNVINEYDLDRLPKTARAIVYPVPYCPSDETFNRLLAFVKSGGALYCSGDIAYDEFRQRTRAERFAQLGLQDVGEHKPMTVVTTSVVANPQMAQVGQGKVFFTPYPLEARASEEDRAVYQQFLTFANVTRIHIEPDNPNVHVFSIPTADGGTVYVLFNADTVERGIKVAITTSQSLTLTLAPQKPGLAWLNARGELLAVEASGTVSVGSHPVLTCKGHLMLAALDGRDVSASQRLFILPIEAGPIALQNKATWRRPVVAAGEIERGKWRTLEKWTPTRHGQGIIVDVNPPRALNVLILAEESALNDTAQQVTRMIGGTPDEHR